MNTRQDSLAASFKIGAREVGLGKPAYLIAEIGSNHDGRLERAKLMITECAKAGADAVKFQSFTADGLYISRTCENGHWTEHPVWRILKQFELPIEWIPELAKCARENSVDFMSTPFEPQAVDALEKVGALAYKISSGDMTHVQLLRQVARTGKPVLIATGIGEAAEARKAVETVLAAGNRQVGLFHCVSLYPPRYDEMNLRAVATLHREFGCPSGLSDHTPGYDMVLGAIALGATLIEKHVTLDRALPGPDHPYALLVDEFAVLVQAVRRLESALGDGVKHAVEREISEKTGARRGLYAARSIPAGAALSPELIKARRPALGIAADQIDLLLGATALRDIEQDAPLSWSDVARSGKILPKKT
jgi:N,N'-diacetyllegionaminate synthase